MNDIKTIEEKFKEAINNIADDKLASIEEFNTIKEWHDKYDKQGDKREIITKHIIPKIIEFATPYFTKIFIENLTIKSEFIRDGITSSIEFDLKPIKPYIDIVLKADSAKIHSMRFTFQIDSHINISNLKFVKDDTINIFIDTITLVITISLIKIVNDIEPLEIGSKEFTINDLSLSF